MVINQTKFFIKTLGCDKNTVDSQWMASLLLEAGFQACEAIDDAEIVLVNTCCFIDPAKEESIDVIFECARCKKTGVCHTLIVAGCMAQRYGRDLVESMPEVDFFVGVNDLEKIIAVLKKVDDRKIHVNEEEKCFHEIGVVPHIREGEHFAYLKIAEGCNKHCTYCAIPSIRGCYRSRQPLAIYADAAYYESRGVQELILIAQDITQYGEDLAEPIDLAMLLTHLAEDFHFSWIRLMYLYPEGIDENILDVISTHDNICHYLDIPIQHTENKILKSMGRKIDKSQICGKLRLIRKKIPDVILRTTVITGFPGETEEDFEGMLSTLKAFAFDRLGAFAYSQEEGTPAAKMKNQIDADIKELRRKLVYDMQETITARKNHNLVGKVVSVLVDEVCEDIAYGRTAGDAPEIDCGVVLSFGEDVCIEAGHFYPVRIYHALSFDLMGEVIVD